GMGKHRGRGGRGGSGSAVLSLRALAAAGGGWGGGGPIRRSTWRTVGRQREPDGMDERPARRRPRLRVPGQRSGQDRIDGRREARRVAASSARGKGQGGNPFWGAPAVTPISRPAGAPPRSEGARTRAHPVRGKGDGRSPP